MSFNPMGDNSRWALVLTGQVQPTPEEARILAILKQLGGDVGSVLGQPVAPAANHQPTDFMGMNAIPGTIMAGMQESGGKLLGAGAAGLRGLDQAVGSGMPSQSVYGGMQDYVKKLEDVGTQAYGQAAGPGAYSPANAMQADGPAPMSMADYQNAPSITNPSPPPTGPMPNPEQAYAQAFSAANAGGGSTPSGLPGLGSGGVGPTGAKAGSSAAYPDETTRSLNRAASTSSSSGSLPGPNDPGFIGPKQSKAETDYTLEYDRAKDTGSDFLSRRRQLGQEYESEPDTWVRDLMASKGRSTQWDPYNARWAETWQSRMPLLLDFYVMGRGGDPYNPDDRTKALEEFGPQIISGNVNPSMVIQKALDAARGDERIMNMLVAEGPERIMQMRQLASGQSNRVSEALNTSLRRKVDEERRRQIATLGSQDTDRRRYVDIASGKG